MFLGTLTEEEIKSVKNKNQNTCISLFSGCGGMDLGFRWAGWETRVMIEWDKAACDTLRLNWIKPSNWKEQTRQPREHKPMYEGDDWSWRDGRDIWQERDPVIMERDIKTVSVEEVLSAAKLKIGECGIVIGGFPCQGFSLAGSRMIDDPRNSLYKECIRMVRGILPRAFLFENVPGLISMDKGKIINQICTDLAESGYQVSWQKLNAADYGVPQRRVRIFFIGTRNDVMVFPEKGNPQYHMGGAPGPVKHPDFYLEKFKIQNIYAENYQQKLL